MWKGAISFGLVSISVRLYTATEEHDFRLHQVHKADQGRVRYRKVCSVDGEELAADDIAKAYELDDGRLVVLEAAELAELPVSTDHSIQVLEFVELRQVDPMYFQKTYYVEPDPAAERPYVLLRQVLRDADRMALVKITMRQRESLAVLRARDDVIVLHTMMWPDEIRTPDFPFLDKEIGTRKNELDMAQSLVDTMSGEFAPQGYTDDYRDAMGAMIEAKAEGTALPAAPEAPKGSGEVVDLMTALRRSIERTKGPAAIETPAAAPKEEAPAEKTTAKKAPAKKTAAKKAATTKAAAKKTPATKKATTTKAAATKAAATKAPAKKTTAKKTAATKAPARKASGG
ncbi:hypothetical protein GCM10027047_20560 [Rhodococcus aerolatus]